MIKIGSLFSVSFILFSTVILADQNNDLDRIIGAQTSFQALGKKKSDFKAGSQEELAKQVKSALKKLIKEYHPDRPIEGLVEKQRIAIAKINKFLDNPLADVKVRSNIQGSQKKEKSKTESVDSWTHEIARWSSRLQSANISEFKIYKGTSQGKTVVAYGDKGTDERVKNEWVAVFKEIIKAISAPEYADIKSKFVALRDYAIQLFEFSKKLSGDQLFQKSGQWSGEIKKGFDTLVKKEQKAQKLVAPGALKRIKNFFSSNSVDKGVAKRLDDFARAIFNLLHARTKALDRSRGIERIEESLGLPV